MGRHSRRTCLGCREAASPPKAKKKPYVRKQKIHTIESFRDLVKLKGGVLISSEFRGLQKPLELECQNKHRWTARPHSIIYDKTWCPSCFNSRRQFLTRLDQSEVDKKLAEIGYSSTDSHKRVDSKTEFTHTLCGSKFVSTLKRILKEDNPCPKCGKRDHLNKESAQKYAEEKGGRLLFWAGQCAAASSWSCSEGHSWSSGWSRMFSNQAWCPKCRSRFVSRSRRTKSEIWTLSRKTWGSYRRSDYLKGRDFDLTTEDIVKAKESLCHYCSRAASGLDRIDNSIGHTKANTVPCCVRCNWTRGSWMSHSVMEQVGKVLREIDP